MEIEMRGINKSFGDNAVLKNAGMALGAVEAVENRKILVVDFDATDDAVAAVKAGKMAATVAQKPDLMGETAIETAIQILQGETVKKTFWWKWT